MQVILPDGLLVVRRPNAVISVPLGAQAPNAAGERLHAATVLEIEQDALGAHRVPRKKPAVGAIQNTDGPRRVARCVYHLQLPSPQFQAFPIRERPPGRHGDCAPLFNPLLERGQQPLFLRDCRFPQEVCHKIPPDIIGTVLLVDSLVRRMKVNRLKLPITADVVQVPVGIDDEYGQSRQLSGHRAVVQATKAGINQHSAPGAAKQVAVNGSPVFLNAVGLPVDLGNRVVRFHHRTSFLKASERPSVRPLAAWS